MLAEGVTHGSNCFPELIKDSEDETLWNSCAQQISSVLPHLFSAKPGTAPPTDTMQKTLPHTQQNWWAELFLTATALLPDPSWNAQCHLTKWTNKDKVKVYLHTFEWRVAREEWNKDDRASIVSPFLCKKINMVAEFHRWTYRQGINPDPSTSSPVAPVARLASVALGPNPKITQARWRPALPSTACSTFVSTQTHSST